MPTNPVQKHLEKLLKRPIDYIASRVAASLNANATWNQRQERLLLAQGKQLANWARTLPDVARLDDAEFSIFSQFGDDGIIQYLINHLVLKSKTFIEFGIENYRESNTRFLLMNDNWSGFVMDGSDAHIKSLQNAYYFWRHDLTAKAAFVTAENINDLLAERSFPEVDLLHIDLDGNDYWVWKTIATSPAIVSVEYNSVFGNERAITVPYEPDFQRAKAHFSNLYAGASLAALTSLAGQKGYALVGSNSAGNDAYFVRRDLLNAQVREVSVAEGYRLSKYRESRAMSGELTYLSGDDRRRAIQGLPVVNVETDEIEEL